MEKSKSVRAFLDLQPGLHERMSFAFAAGRLLWGRGFCAMLAYSNSSDGISCALNAASLGLENTWESPRYRSKGCVTKSCCIFHGTFPQAGYSCARDLCADKLWGASSDGDASCTTLRGFPAVYRH